MTLQAREFCKRIKYESPPCWLTLLGKSGVGKTQTARAICDWYKEHLAGSYWVGDSCRIRKARYVYWVKWLAQLKQRDLDIGEAICDLASHSLVVLDDIGAEYQDKSGFLNAELYSLLAMREGKWTVIVSNLTYEGVQQRIDVRLASRIIRDDSLIFELNAPDLIDWNLPEHPRHHRKQSAA